MARGAAPTEEGVMSLKPRVAHWGVLVAGCLLAAAACGSGADGAGATGSKASVSSGVPDTAAIIKAVSADSHLASQVPARIAQAHSLKIGSNMQSAPNNFYAADGKTPV